jgi:tRNA pseudouridine55 synthase
MRYPFIIVSINNFELNKIKYDEFGRANGILAVNKPIGMTSHDVVDHFRKVFKPSKVGHAGTLDPFASGILIILIGKATRDSDVFLGKDKEYVAEVLLGVSTTTGDPEGEIADYKLKIKNDGLDLKGNINEVINSFMPSYDQFVPVFSSVKVGGDKLRVLARKYDHFEIEEVNGSKIVKFYDDKDVLKKEVSLPHKEVKIYEIELLEIIEKTISVGEDNRLRLETGDWRLDSLASQSDFKSQVSSLQSLKIRVKCSKGTYIRQLAVDIGEKLGIPAMLVGLERTKVGEITLIQSYTVNQFDE